MRETVSIDRDWGGGNGLIGIARVLVTTCKDGGDGIWFATAWLLSQYKQWLIVCQHIIW